MGREDGVILGCFYGAWGWYGIGTLLWVVRMQWYWDASMGREDGVILGRTLFWLDLLWHLLYY